MFWLYNKLTNYNFYQVFTEKNIQFQNDDNIIYLLESDTMDSNISKIKYEYSTHTITIRIMDQLISYIDDTDNDYNNDMVFCFKMDFIDPFDESNLYDLPVFHFKYKKVNNNCMPNVLPSIYSVYTTLDFQIYKINDKVQYIIETNPQTKIIKKYFITEELNLIKNLIGKFK